MVPRRFLLRRYEDESGVSGVGDVAWGVMFPDGSAVTRWMSNIASTAVWSDISHVDLIHGHGGKTELVWIDEETS